MINARPAAPRAHALRASAGMTLIELMIVVIIVAILAGVGTTAYSVYVRRSRAGEARTILALIANREAAYRAEFNTYVSAGRSGAPTSVGISSSWPTASPTTGPADWYASLPTEWSQLGVRPSRPVWFRYVVVAGSPGVSPPGESGYSSSPNQDIWYVAEAYGDLNQNGTTSTFHLFSQGGTVQVTDETE